MIAIVDLNIGNLANVKKALDGTITNEASVIDKADKVVLPGVGNFGAVMENLNPLREVLLDSINDGKPFLGICLGMQLLFEESEESEGEGLGVIDGKVKKFQNVKTPHIGWNQLWTKKSCEIFEGIGDGSYFYFVHSYYVDPEDEGFIAGLTDYRADGDKVEFVSAVCKDNVFGTQFHPEKSSDNGLRILENFKDL